MAEREGDTEEDRDQIRLLRKKEVKAMNARHQLLIDMDNAKTERPFSSALLKDRLGEIRSHMKRLEKLLNVLREKETEEEKREEDEEARSDILARGFESVTLCMNLQVWKDVSILIESTADSLEAVETLKTEDSTLDLSLCLEDVNKQMKEMYTRMKEFAGPPNDPLWTNVKALKVRVVRALAQKKPDMKPMIAGGEEVCEFKLPKINIPKFKGGLEAWHAFWNRFRTAVHENTKVSEPAKLAILIDLVVDPALNEYLEAANDGKEGRYDEILAYLKSRFDRPKELHEIYCRKLADLAPIKDTPSDLSRAADTVFAAVSGLQRSGQADVDSIATSLVASTLPPRLKLKWDNKTEDKKEVTNIAKWIEFVRKKSSSASEIPKQHVPKASSKPAGKVHIASSQPTSSPEPLPQRFRNKAPRSFGPGCQTQCILCNNMHYIYQCKVFLEMDVGQRKNHAQANSLCMICLRSDHQQKDCNSTYKCRVCMKNHNTLLHQDVAAAAVSVAHLTTKAKIKRQDTDNRQKLMMTSQVWLTSSTGKKIEARAMLDTGAAVSVLSNRMMKLLQLKRSEEWLTVSGIESPKNSPARPTAQVTITSKCNPAWSTSVKAVILPKPARNLPEHRLPALEDMPHLKGLGLADPHFSEPRRVDMILDVGFFNEVLLSEKKQGPSGTPSAWKTELGWGVMGYYAVPDTLPFTNAVNAIAVAPAESHNLNRILEQFWLREELPIVTPVFSAEDLAIQKHFLATHYFSKSLGRYIVTLPKKDTKLQLGESYRTALNRFLKNEQSLIRKGKYKEFQEVVQEYFSLGHAQEVTPEELCTPVPLTYCLPMHAVYKQSSTSTKVRVVFDGSCPTSTGASFNDILAAGPTLYPNLDKILIKFLGYRVAVSADIAKMYREVGLCQADRQLHRFLWRATPTEPVRIFCMNRVTFGVTSSPYVSVRAMQQTAEDFLTPGSTLKTHIQK